MTVTDLAIPPRPAEANSRDIYGHELRTVIIAAPQVRAATDGGPLGFTGHAAVFNSRTWIGSKSWGFWEDIAPGAFAKTILEADVRFLINHDPNYVLARTTAGNLRLSEDTVGLVVDADMTPTSYARDLTLSLDAGDVTQMSFAFRIVKEEYTQLDDGKSLYTIKEAELFDVSAVTYPAYTDTDAALRSRAFSVLGRAMGLEGVDTRDLLEALDTGRVTEETAPVIRAAAKALGDLAPEPPDGTRTEQPEPEPPTRRCPHLAMRTLATATTLTKEN